LDYAMSQLYKVFVAESQKPGKTFHALVRRRRRELGLPVPTDERLLPFHWQHSASLPAIDVAIDCGQLDDSGSGATLDLQRTERRLEELVSAIEDAARRGDRAADHEKLRRAYELELRAHEAIRFLVRGREAD
jgi:hypothetical protein